MDGHVDWLSFTLEHKMDVITHMDLYKIGRAKLKEKGKEHETLFFNGQSFDPAVSRAPYRLCLVRADGHARLYGGSHTATVLYEVSGRGCEVLRDHAALLSIFAGVYDRLTRFDYAVDIATATLPSEFANERSNDIFRSVSFIRSDTGETVYSGSPKSDRFCRVYRYHHPHPRAHLLRVEFVFRRRLARAAAEQYTQCENPAQFLAQLGNTWGWKHRDWRPDIASDEKIRTPIISHKDEDTLMWLYRQVAPAMRRMYEAGSLDLSDFLTHVVNQPGDGD